MSTEREVVTSRFDAHRKHEIRENGKNPLNSEVLDPSHPTHVVLPPQFHQRIELWNNINEKQEAIGTLITAYTWYILNPTESIGFDLSCKPEEVPKWKQKLYADYTKTCNAVLSDVYAGVNLKSVQSVQLQSDGKFILFTSRWKKELNILDLWNRSIPGASEKDVQKWPLYLPESEHLSEIRRMQARVKQDTRTAQEQVQENLESESFMWGIVQFFYESTPEQVTYAVTPYVAVWWLAWSAVYHGSRNTVRVLKSITFRGPDGKIHPIEVASHSIQWTKEWMRKNLLQILEKFDLQYDPKVRWFYNPQIYTFEKVQWMLKMMTYERYKKMIWENAVSENEWNRMKKNLMEADITDFYKWLTRGQRITDALQTFLKNNALELVFYPLAFEHFRRNQTDVNLIRGISWWTAAIAGIKIGRKAPGGAIVKFVAWAIAWAGMMMYSDKKLTASVNKWEYFFSKDSWEYIWHEKSRIGHAISSLWLNEAWDIINNHVLPGGREDPIDINMLPRIDMLRFPKVSILQSSISVGMNPWDWIRDSAIRDISSWNEKLPKYTEKLIKDILELVWAFIRKDPPFSRWDTQEKFKEKFNSLIFPGEGQYYSEAREQILGVVLAEMGSWTGGQSEAIITDIIRSKSTDFYINSENLMKRKEKLVERKQQIDEKTKILIGNIKKPITTQSFSTQYAPKNLPKPISVEEQSKYITGIFDRMTHWQEIVTPSRWEKTEALWTPSKRLILSEDVIVFQSILEDSSKLEWGWGVFTIAEFFATLLDDMAEYTQESMFIDQVLKWNNKGYVWK